jgi:hypothetical protein
MARRQNPTESQDKDAANVVTPDFDSGGEKPMDRFRALTRRLLRVSPKELGRERERHSTEKHTLARKG